MRAFRAAGGSFLPLPPLSEAEQIAADYAEALRQYPVKVVAAAAGHAAPDTVKEWRAGRGLSGLVRGVMVARRIPKLCRALVELSGESSLLAPLIAELEAIAAGPDDVSAARARSALTKFAAAVDGDGSR